MTKQIKLACEMDKRDYLFVEEGVAQRQEMVFECYGYDVLLNKEKAKQLRDFLNEWIEEQENEKSGQTSV